MNEQAGFLEKTFKLSANNTNVKTEFIAGFTTFMTMAYILAVNPFILSTTGMDKGAVFTATVVASIIGTLVMALYANLPFALAPGMGLNAIFAFTICGVMGIPWQTALAAVLVEGIIFIILGIFNIREAIINAIPMAIKNAISVGIGLFIAFIGILNSGIAKSGKFITPDGGLDGLAVTLGDITSPAVILSLIGLIITALLIAKGVKGGILIGIVATTIIGIPMGIVSFDGVQAFNLPPSLSPIAFQFDFSKLWSPDMLLALFTLLFVDMFDTVGTLIGVSTRANMLTEKGEVPRAKQALMADAIATTAGAMLGTSTVTTYVESASGVTEGGRTGLTSVFTSLFFVVALFFSGVFLIVPPQATAPALIIVGMYMCGSVVNIDWQDMNQAIPAFLTFAIMPFTYSIAEGITFGVLFYVFISLFTGKKDELKVSTYVLTLFLLAKVVFMFFQ